MRIVFPWAMRCPVCILGLVLGWPCCRRKTKHGEWLVYFKSRENRSKLVGCLHTPLAMPAMFQSKRKPSEEMLSKAAHLYCHAIRVPLLSRVLNLSHLSSPASLSLLLHPRILTFSYLLARSMALSPQCNSSIKWPVQILADKQVNRSCGEVGVRCVFLVSVWLAAWRWACLGTCVQRRNLRTKGGRCRLSPASLLSFYLSNLLGSPTEQIKIMSRCF